jgi:hypothetical protein
MIIEGNLVDRFFLILNYFINLKKIVIQGFKSFWVWRQNVGSGALGSVYQVLTRTTSKGNISFS